MAPPPKKKTKYNRSQNKYQRRSLQRQKQKVYRKNRNGRKPQGQRKRTHPYSLRSSSALVAEVPRCATEEQRTRYSRLDLNSDLFCSSTRPAKRKQSVITISSSDEDLGKDRTIEWVSTIELDSDSHSFRDEEPLNSACPSSKRHEKAQTKNAEQQTSTSKIQTAPASVFKPLCVSTPEVGNLKECMAQMRLAPSTNVNDSVFPVPTNSNDIANRSVQSNEPASNPISTQTSASTFYFGTPNSFQGSSFASQILTNYMFFGINQMSNTTAISTSVDESYEKNTTNSLTPLSDSVFKPVQEDPST